MAAGTSTITATQGAVTGNTLLTVTPPTNLISNGSFELPNLGPAGTIVYVAGGDTGTIPSWNVVGSVNGNVGQIRGPLSFAGITTTAQEGSQFADLTGTNDLNHISNMALEQTISTTTGTSYTLAFYLGNNNGGGLNGTTSTVIAKVNGNTLFTAVNNQFNNDGTTKWVLFTGNFQATGTSTVISLQCGDPDTDTTDFIDNVSVTPTNT